MSIIEVSEYPIIRDWDTKVFSIPKIPRSSNGYPEALKTILMAVKVKNPIANQLLLKVVVGKTH
ncbi:hypothetical protein [Priestia megaterium]|uniref:hypothetical protein n=1 Tax=Priestia megaterium TaxID=1404 RepID=UPI0011A282E1|nr:hypothetical protein [Priestia megaterium]